MTLTYIDMDTYQTEDGYHGCVESDVDKTKYTWEYVVSSAYKHHPGNIPSSKECHQEDKTHKQSGYYPVLL